MVTGNVNCHTWIMGINHADLCKSSKHSQMLNHFPSPNPGDFKSQRLFSDYKSFMYWLPVVALNIIKYYVFFCVARVHAQVCLCVYCDIDCSQGLAQATTTELAVSQPFSDLLLEYFSGKTLGFTCIFMFSFKFFFTLPDPLFYSLPGPFFPGLVLWTFSISVGWISGSLFALQYLRSLSSWLLASQRFALLWIIQSTGVYAKLSIDVLDLFGFCCCCFVLVFVWLPNLIIRSFCTF